MVDTRIKGEALRELINGIGELVNAHNRITIALQAISDKSITYTEDDEVWSTFPYMNNVTLENALETLSQLKTFMDNGNRANLAKLY